MAAERIDSGCPGSHDAEAPEAPRPRPARSEAAERALLAHWKRTREPLLREAARRRGGG